MVVSFQGKGMLVPVYFLVSLFISAGLSYEIGKRIGFSLRFSIALGLGFLISAFLTYIFRNDYYKNDKGEKVKLNIKNKFLFIDMKWWAYIELTLGIAGLIYGFVRTFTK